MALQLTIEIKFCKKPYEKWKKNNNFLEKAHSSQVYLRCRAGLKPMYALSTYQPQCPHTFHWHNVKTYTTP
jgi:hypothetical protein